MHADRQGRYIRYRANFAAMQALIDFLRKDCCGGDASKCAPEVLLAANRIPVRARGR